ncbi:MAG: arsenosugar biosynthesis arsenite methyltransferase ArsM [Myxococcota bacterium]
MQTTPPSYLGAIRDLYAEAAATPDSSLCCVAVPPWRMPDLDIPQVMFDMNYGCGTTVQPRDVPDRGSVLYVGVGGGLELLQFAALTRRAEGVVGIDNVPEMIARCRDNLRQAQQTNPWLTEDMVSLREGDALDLPVADGSVQLFAQNCLFNVFRADELDRALAEAHRVLGPAGALSMSDPVCQQPIPEALQADERLRAMCLSGALPLEAYLDRIVAAGFGTIEVRARRPYRILDPRQFPALEARLLLESVEVVAYKTPVPADGPCIFTGRTATWLGSGDVFDDGKGHVLQRGIPAAVCDKTAGALAQRGDPDLVFTPSTWHYHGGGCC